MLASTTRVHAPPVRVLAPSSRGSTRVIRDYRRTVHVTRAVSESPPASAGPGEVERAPGPASEEEEANERKEAHNRMLSGG